MDEFSGEEKESEKTWVKRHESHSCSLIKQMNIVLILS